MPKLTSLLRRFIQAITKPEPKPAKEKASYYPGDFRGKLITEYSPVLDGDADPGEVVWAWVPFEEDHSRGKDRPILIVGRDGKWLLGLMLTSKDHTGENKPTQQSNRWLDLGVGDWDAQRRPSEVRLDRIIRISPKTVRREGAILDRKRFDLVVSKVNEIH